MDFSLPRNVEHIRKQIRDFVNKEIIPFELDRSVYDRHENIREENLQKLRQKARSKGLWALSMPKERGGQQFDAVGMAACYEEMGRSIFGPVVFNAAAPDDGNMFVLNKVVVTALPRITDCATFNRFVFFGDDLRMVFFRDLRRAMLFNNWRRTYETIHL